MGKVWSTGVDIYFVTPDMFGQHKLSYVSFPGWHGICLTNDEVYIFFLAGMERVYINTSLHTVYVPLALEGFGKMMLRCISVLTCI